MWTYKKLYMNNWLTFAVITAYMYVPNIAPAIVTMPKILPSPICARTIPGHAPDIAHPMPNTIPPNAVYFVNGFL